MTPRSYSRRMRTEDDRMNSATIRTGTTKTARSLHASSWQRSGRLAGARSTVSVSPFDADDADALAGRDGPVLSATARHSSPCDQHLPLRVERASCATPDLARRMPAAPVAGRCVERPDPGRDGEHEDAGRRAPPSG